MMVVEVVVTVLVMIVLMMVVIVVVIVVVVVWWYTHRGGWVGLSPTIGFFHMLMLMLIILHSPPCSPSH